MKKRIAVVLLALLIGWAQGYAQEADYQCPMHSGVHQAEPGDCPECGMHLEPVSK